MNKEKGKFDGKKPNIPLRQMVAIVAIGGIVITGGSKIIHAAEGEHKPIITLSEYAAQVGGYVDKDVTSIIISEDGKIRSSPDVIEDSAGNTNKLVTTDKKITITTYEGAIISYNINGDWISVPAAFVKEADPDIDIDSESGYVSISTQRAKLIRATVDNNQPTNSTSQ